MNHTLQTTETILLSPGFHQACTPQPKVNELRAIAPDELCLTSLKKRQWVKSWLKTPECSSHVAALGELLSGRF